MENTPTDGFNARKITLELTDAARAYLAEKGYDKQNGARPLARLIDDELKRALSDELLFGNLEHGGHAVVDAKDGALVFAYTPPPAAPDAPPRAAVADA